MRETYTQRWSTAELTGVISAALTLSGDTLSGGDTVSSGGNRATSPLAQGSDGSS